MNIYKNLLLIDKYQLYHPKWEIVETSKDLDKFYKIKDYCGFTIRVFYTKDDKFRQPLYANWVARNQVPRIVDKFSSKAKKNYKIVVYPSWKLNKSGTLLLDSNQIIIEACSGHASNLIRKGNCQLGLIYNYRKKTISEYGDSGFLSVLERKKVLSAVDKVKKRGIILEWAIGQKNEFIFYKLEDLKEAGKKLLEKYS